MSVKPTKNGFRALEMDVQPLVLITARAGSKGLPGKNVAPLCGKPLIAHVIAAAKKANCAGRVVVSTDGEDIAEVSRRYGAEVPFMRPAELATDTAPHIGSLKHALETLALEDPPYRPKWIILLQPTSPFTTAEDIDAAMQLAVDRDARSIVSVCKAQQHPFKMFCADDAGALETLVIANAAFPKTVEYLRRQDLPEAYQQNGAIYIHRSQDILDETSKDVPFVKHCRTRECFGYVMPAARSHDIDSIEDLHLCEYLMTKSSGLASAKSASTGMEIFEPPLLSTEDALRRRIDVLEKELAGWKGRRGSERDETSNNSE